MKIVSQTEKALSVEITLSDFKKLMSAVQTARQEFQLLDPGIHRMKKEDVNKLDDELTAVWRDYLARKS